MVSEARHSPSSPQTCSAAPGPRVRRERGRGLEKRVDFGWVGWKANLFAGQRAAGAGLPPRVGLKTFEETLSSHHTLSALGDEGSEDTEGSTLSPT